MRCGNDPRARLTPGDRAVVDAFRAQLTERARAVWGEHRWELGHRDEAVGREYRRCLDCGVAATRWWRQRSRFGVEELEWVDWVGPDGRTWHTAPGDHMGPPACPLPTVEALCPWEPDARRYDHAWGDAQLDVGMRTWCARHEMAVADCPNPGPPCPGVLAHEDGEPGRPGPCTGYEESCRCMCPGCLDETPDMYGAPDH